MALSPAKNKLGKLKKKQHNVSGRSGRISRTTKAGLQFPVSRIHRYLRRRKYSKRIAAGAPVYLAAALEYLVAEVLELSGNAARDNKKRRINPRAIVLAIRSDEELSQLMPRVIVPSGGVLPNIHSVLLQKKKRIQREQTKKTSQENT